jgi:DHA1 family bicyclomycin/chloramphenicol resistance-like MFS transporter
VLLNTLGWRSVFWALLLMVGALLVWTARSLPETLPRAARQTLRPGALWRNYRAVVTRVDFLLLALIPALNFAAFFLYVAVAPAFLLNLVGVTTNGFAWLFVPMIGGIMIGATLSGRLAGRVSPQRTVRLGYALMFAGAALNLALAWLVPPGVPWSILPIMVYTIGTALLTPTLTLLLLDLFPAQRGMAASLQGFVQFALSAFNAGTIAPLLAHSVAALALGMAGFTGASFALWLVYQRGARRELGQWTP